MKKIFIIIGVFFSTASLIHADTKDVLARLSTWHDNKLTRIRTVELAPAFTYGIVGLGIKTLAHASSADHARQLSVVPFILSFAGPLITTIFFQYASDKRDEYPSNHLATEQYHLFCQQRKLEGNRFYQHKQLIGTFANNLPHEDDKQTLRKALQYEEVALRILDNQQIVEGNHRIRERSWLALLTGAYTHDLYQTASEKIIGPTLNHYESAAIYQRSNLLVDCYKATEHLRSLVILYGQTTQQHSLEKQLRTSWFNKTTLDHRAMLRSADIIEQTCDALTSSLEHLKQKYDYIASTELQDAVTKKFDRLWYFA